MAPPLAPPTRLWPRPLGRLPCTCWSTLLSAVAGDDHDIGTLLEPGSLPLPAGGAGRGGWGAPRRPQLSGRLGPDAVFTPLSLFVAHQLLVAGSTPPSQILSQYISLKLKLGFLLFPRVRRRRIGRHLSYLVPSSFLSTHLPADRVLLWHRFSFLSLTCG